MNSKRWVIGLLVLTAVLLILGAAPTVLVDPYFHFHKPLPQLNYPMDNQRYQNDGILKNFSYDAVITGSSMTENFKTSELDALFGTKSVKTSYSGGSLKEIRDALENAFKANPDIRYVIRGIDCNQIAAHKDSFRYDDGIFPTYLYDWNPLNDVFYVFNAHVLFSDTSRVLAHTLAGIEGTTFDEYSNWQHKFEFGAEAIKKDHNRPEKTDSVRSVLDSEYEVMRGNMEQNLIRQAIDHPDTQFYYFITPYSIMWWDEVNQSGNLEWYISMMREASRLMTAHDNIHLFSFFDVPEVVCDLNNYHDIAHYGESVNSMILQWMRNEEHRLTAQENDTYWDSILAFYSSYPYDTLYQ